MRLKTSTIFWTFVWCLFMGVTAGSIGLGALYPPLNYIAGPFVCPGAQMQVDQQVYNPYPGTTVTTLTWYCANPATGRRTELSLLPISLVAGLIYGFAFFVVVIVGMWLLAGRRTPTPRASVSVDPELESLRALESEEQPHMGGGSASQGAVARMKELQQLRSSNLISEVEYQEKRRQILNGL